MKKLSAIFLFLLCATGAFAQTQTAVSATITDPSGIPYANGTFSIQLVPGGTNPSVNGAAIQGAFNGSTSATGSFSISLWPNASITPGSTQWSFTICSNSGGIQPPLGTGTQCTPPTAITISGTAQVLSTTLSNVAPKLTNFAGTGSVTNVTGTSPIVSSGGTTPAISCPTCGTVTSVTATSPIVSSGGATPALSCPACAVGASTQLVQNGLMADFEMLPSENPCALVDASGNGNNATGCVGTSPTIIAGTGGVLFGGTGAISLPATLNSALSVQIFYSPGNGNGGAILAGNGTVGNLLLTTPTRVTGTNDSVISGYPDAHNLRLLTGRVDTAPFAGIGSYPRAIVPAALDVAWTMNGAATDIVYLNGVATNSYITQGNATGNGHQTNGNYQLGGIASASCTNWSANLCNFLTNGAQMYKAFFYNRLLSATEIQQNHAYIMNRAATNGVSTSLFKPADATNGGFVTIAVDGDSLSCGACAGTTPVPTAPYTAYLFGLNGSTSVTNQALGGRQLFLNLVPAANQAMYPLFYPYTAGNLDVCAFCGTNDSTLAQYQGGINQYVQELHTVGFRVMIAGVLDGKGDTIKNTFNGWLRQNWEALGIDCFVDVAADPSLGADGAQNNTTDFYTTDKLHIQDNGIINHEAPYIKRGINRCYGNHDFSSATVYSSAALAATATASGTSSATQNVITVGATPANCVAGSWVLVAGVTPSGYNGVFYLTSTTGTTLTMHNPPSQSSLANISVNGTVVCPQQQDADQYQVVNFGTGNFSLQTCIGLTGQDIYIQNINAVATTLLPWNAETITGAAATPTTLAANTTAILQSQLVSPSAAGCNWVRLQ